MSGLYFPAKQPRKISRKKNFFPYQILQPTNTNELRYKIMFLLRRLRRVSRRKFQYPKAINYFITK